MYLKYDDRFLLTNKLVVVGYNYRTIFSLTIYYEHLIKTCNAYYLKFYRLTIFDALYVTKDVTFPALNVEHG